MLRKISIRDLRPGMVVATMKADIWLQSPSLYTRPGLVKSEDEVRRIREAGFLEVFIEVDPAEEKAENETPPEPEHAPLAKVSLGEELLRAREIYAAAIQAVGIIFARASRGAPIDLRAARRAVASLERSVDRNPAALGCLACLSEVRAYLQTHAVNTAVLALFSAGRWGLAREEVLNVGLAALLHDLGKSRLPPEVLGNAGTLPKDRRQVLQSHCVHGLSLLEGCLEMPREVKRAVMEHHERHDGTGYPFGLKGDQISVPGRIVALCNCFDGLTGPRPHRKGMPPAKALAAMFGQRGAAFAPDDVDRFIKHLGVYPSGSLVRLSDGRMGVVCELHPEEPLAPLVNVVLDARLNPMICECVDLLRREDLEIVESVDPGPRRQELLLLLAGARA